MVSAGLLDYDPSELRGDPKRYIMGPVITGGEIRPLGLLDNFYIACYAIHPLIMNFSICVAQYHKLISHLILPSYLTLHRVILLASKIR